MNSKIQYYVFDKDINRNEFDVPLEFEVYGKIVKDIDGKDIQVFIKEDNIRGVRRDSSFYWDGEWEVFEFDDSANETRFRASSGIKALFKYDDKMRLTEKYLVDEKNKDTLISEQYEWRNGHLVRMIENGLTRIYLYGKKVTDPVIVVPTDNDLYYHPGYNGSIGMMPTENNPMYKYFAMNPYRYYPQNYDESQISFALKKSVLPLPKSNNYNSCANIGLREKNNMPSAECIRYIKQNIPIGHEKEKYYEGIAGNATFGRAFARLSGNFECKCNNANGHFYIAYDASNITTGEFIKVMRSNWKYDNAKKDWQELCWNLSDMQETYSHEVKHIENARAFAKKMYDTHIIAPNNEFSTKDKCLERGREIISTSIQSRWDIWDKLEMIHGNTNPKSPTITNRDRIPVTCPK